MNPDTRSQLSNQISEGIAHLDTPGLPEKIASQGDGILSTGMNTAQSFELCRSIFARLRLAFDSGSLDRIPQYVAEGLSSHIAGILPTLHQVVHQNPRFKPVAEPLKNLHNFLWTSNIFPFLEDSPESAVAYIARVRDIVDQLESFTSRAMEAEKAIQAIEHLRGSAGVSAQSIEQMAQAALQSANTAESHANTAQANKNQTDAHRQEAKAYSDTARDAASEANSHKKQIIDFFEEIDANQTKLENVAATARTSVETLTEETQTIVRRNEELQIKIDEILQQAIGASLFTAFDQRRKTLVEGKNIWLLCVGVASIALMALILHLADAASTVSIVDLTLAHVLKLLSTPFVIWLIYFSSSNYSKEREYEEQYAFKSVKAAPLLAEYI